MSSSGKGTESVTSNGLQPFTSLNNVSASTNGAVIDTGSCHANVCVQVTMAATTAPTSINTQILGSLDNVNWFGIGSAITATTNGTQSASGSGIPARYYRVNTTITGGAGVTLSAILGIV